MNVSADVTRARADIDKFRLEQERNKVNLKVDVDTSSAQRSLSKLFGGSGGGGGGFGGGGSFWGGPIGIPLIFTGIGELPAATTAIANVAGALQQLSGAAVAVPGIIGGIVSTVGTVKLALTGVSDAFDAVDKASDGSAKNVEAANKALAKLAPQAADFVRQVSGLKPAFDDLTKSVQGKFFDDLGTSVRQLADADLPVLNRGLGGIATALNGSLKQLGISLSSGSSQGLLDRIFGNTADAQARLTKAIDPLIKGIGTLTAAGTDVLPRLADDVGAVAERFSKFITEADQNGSLSKFINDGITGVEQLGNTFINVGKIINDITSAAGGDGGLLKFLQDGSQKLHDFLSSTEGQNQLKTWFEEGRRELTEHVIPLLQSLPGIFEGIVGAGRVFADDIVPAVRDVATFLGEHPDALKIAIEGIVAATILSKVATLAEGLGKISGLLGGGSLAAGAAGAGGKGGKGRFAGAAGLLGPAALLGGGLTVLNTDAANPDDTLPAIGGALATIGGGALTGSVFGPWGAAVGGLVAGAVVLTDAFIDQSHRIDALHYVPPPGDPGVEPDPVVRPGAVYQPPNPHPDVPNIVDPKVFGPPSALGPTNSLGEGAPLVNILAPGINQGAAQLAPLLAQTAQAKADLATLNSLITTLPSGQVTLKEDTPEAIKRLTDLGVKVTQIPGGTVQVDTSSLADALNKANALNSALLNIGNAAAGATNAVNNIPNAPLRVGPGHASGGVLPGYSPGVDNMLVPLAGGEGIVRPEAVRKYGPGVIHMLNSGFATGGLIPHLGTGALPGPGADFSKGTGSSQGGIGGWFSSLFGGKSNSGTQKDPADWLGEFGAKTLMSFGTTLYKGVLGFFGLDNSILSPDNPYFQDAGKFATGIVGGQGSGSTKPATAKQVREATDKVTDKRNAVAVAQARVDGLKPTTSASARLSATNALSRAQREADQAVTDLAAMQPSQGYAKGGIVGVSRRGYAAGVGRVPLPPSPDIIPLLPPKPVPKPSVPAPSALPAPPPSAAPQDQLQQQQGVFPMGGPGPVAGSSGSVESHTLPAISKGITSGFATAGNIAGAAISAGGGGLGIPGAGAAGQFVSGLFGQFGKIGNDAADVGSALLVGNITAGTTASQYGETLVSPQRIPQTAQSNSPRIYTFNGIDSRNVVDEMRLKDSQDNQAALAQVRG